MKNGKKGFQKIFFLTCAAFERYDWGCRTFMKKAYESMVNYLREHPNNMKINDLKVSKIN